MKYNLDKLIDRRKTNSGKWEFMTIQNQSAKLSTLPFWVADMDFPCPDEVIEAMHKRVDNRIFGYSAPYTPEFYRSVCGWFQHRFDWYVNSSDIFYCSGIVPALGFLIDIMTNEGDQVLVQPPVYRPFYKKINANHRVAIDNKLVEKDCYYEIDYVDFEEKVSDPKTTLFILCSPHNPVGRVWKKEELQKMGELCFKHGVRIIADEIHHDLVNPDSKHIPLAKLFPNDKDKIVTCTAVSKTFNLAGLSYSNIIIHDKHLQGLWKYYVQEFIGINLPNPLSIVAVQSAYCFGEQWLSEVNEYIVDNLKFVKDYFQTNLPMARMKVPEGTYFAWVDVSRYITDENREDIETYLVKEANVLIEGGSIFGEGGKKFIRINIACPRYLVEECVMRIAKALNKIEVGQKAPDFNFSTAFRSDLVFSNEIKKKTLLIFLRYYGCTICQLDLHNLKNEYFKLKENNIDVFVVLQSSKETIKETIKEDTFPFEIICDPQGKIYDEYSVTPFYDPSEMANKKVIQKVKVAYTEGFSHGKYEGNELQLPAVFLIDEEKNILKSHYAKDLDDMPSVDEMILWLNQKGE